MAKQTDTIQNVVDYYANLPYTITVEKEDDGRGVYYTARVIELPDLLMTGATPGEAVAELESVKREWIEEYLKLGNKMPKPLKSRKYSGKVILRIPPSLHETLVKVAELEGVSFNQYMVSSLSKSVGRDEAVRKKKRAIAQR
ncbi:MAG: type II toxin-antitoxin system HicB family antitoxin [Chloroflexi bacterium]|nr:type II toxin-antitoxin system HicB family antitoxin [Chloroflexota bacterium]MBM3172219.1 type II toxin-antitoxin system HicB family antitoxin [Chloroflexota bacterium]MBM3174211.1 type II toxin-antitoxin system HicB family antitoxin [Chloroflexota bacterium]MBM4449904.1 type II toxin-antitoxin system HicB family antitoxin [Chloroflexota bacterium]